MVSALQKLLLLAASWSLYSSSFSRLISGGDALLAKSLIKRTGGDDWDEGHSESEEEAFDPHVPPTVEGRPPEVWQPGSRGRRGALESKWNPSYRGWFQNPQTQHVSHKDV